MLNALGYLLCFKLCWHNRPGPNYNKLPVYHLVTMYFGYGYVIMHTTKGSH